MSEYGYKFQEYEEIIKVVDDVTKPILKHKKQKRCTAEDLKDKLGDKLTMSSLIIDLTNACLAAKNLLQKMQAHNFDLRGKVAELASSEIKKMREQVDGNQKDIMSRIDEVREKVAAPCEEPRTFSEVLGKDATSSSFVLPMKQAMRELKKEDERAKNVVFHGLDLEPGKPKDKQIEQLEQVAAWAVTEILDPKEAREFDVVGLKVLGRVGDSGKAPPVLVTMKSSSEAQHLIKQAYRLNKIKHLRRIFLTADLSKDARVERGKAIEELKKKIRDFPEQRWVIRQGTVTSVGRFTERSSIELNDSKLDKSFNFLN